jgi:hypothetical protein
LLLRTALGFLQLAPRAPELRMLHEWLDRWSGIGHIAVGMHRQGYYFLSLSHIAEGEWRAQFMGDSQLVAPRGYGVAPTPWKAVQMAAWAAVRRASSSTERETGRRDLDGGQIAPPGPFTGY